MSLHIDPSEWKLATVEGGIPYKLLEGSPHGNFDEDNHEVVEELIIEANQLNAFINESFSDYIIIPGIAWWFRPARSLPGFKQCVTKKIDFAPYPEGLLADPFEAHVHEYTEEEYLNTFTKFIKVTVTYGGGISDENADLLDISVNATGEFILIPPNGVGQDEDESIDPTGGSPTAPRPVATPKPTRSPQLPLTKMIPGLEWSLKFKRIPEPYAKDLLVLARDTLGKVNQYAMPILMDDPPETVLFSGFSMTRKWTWRSEAPFFECDMKLLEKCIRDGNYKDHTPKYVGHNHAYNPKTKKWQYLYRDVASKLPLYDQTDLNQLFFGSQTNPSNDQ